MLANTAKLKDCPRAGTALVRGIGNVGSAVAHSLFKAGFRVLIHDVPTPLVCRRGMSFSDAVYDGSATLDGVVAEAIDDQSALRRILDSSIAIPVFTGPFNVAQETIAWNILVDARMRKRIAPEAQSRFADLSIGLGPGFIAGVTVDAVIETAWGSSLGRVLWYGEAEPPTGQPQSILGYGRERFLRAPVAGSFHTTYQLGSLIQAGTPVGRIGSLVLKAPLDGVISGILRDGAEVESGTRVVETDPRGRQGVIHGVAERPRRIAQIVLDVALEAVGEP